MNRMVILSLLALFDTDITNNTKTTPGELSLPINHKIFRDWEQEYGTVKMKWEERFRVMRDHDAEEDRTLLEVWDQALMPNWDQE
jgi:hypothetical protein